MHYVITKGAPPPTLFRTLHEMHRSAQPCERHARRRVGPHRKRGEGRRVDDRHYVDVNARASMSNMLKNDALATVGSEKYG